MTSKPRLKEIIVAFLIVSITVAVVLFIAASSIRAGSQTTSSTLASSIIDQARKYLNDPTVYGGTQYGPWADAVMLQWVNDGTLDIVSRSHCLISKETETLVENQTAYTLADAFIKIKYVIYNDEYTLKPGDVNTFGRTGSTDDSEGEPTHWGHIGNDVIVYPKPDSDAAGNEIDVYVVERPIDVAGGASVLVPAQYDRALVYYVVAQALKKDNRPGTSAAYTAEYMAELNRFREDLNTQPQQAPE